MAADRPGHRTRTTSERESTPPNPENLTSDYTPLSATPEAGSVGRDTPRPHARDSQRAEDAFEQAKEAARQGDEPLAVEHFLDAGKLAEFAREWYLAAVAYHHVGDFLCKPAPPQDLPRAVRMYHRAIVAYESCGLSNEARELRYRIMKMRLRHGQVLNTNWRQRIELFLFWVIAGFGHRPARILVIAAAAIFLFGALYWWTEGIRGVDVHEPIGFWNAVYFSGITFCTVGYGDMIPTPSMRLVAMFEGAMGAFAIGFFAAVMANRLLKI